ncbi:hypothetical protein [Parvibaculum sp.]|uniref:hypothetical protein n=1 Tax=Parvibaculum sp. TaxID=2024848 RepID=UPI001B022A2E|nr:hypothetical protein [Parvibaculum sp.]MBO6634424.1 hypothetical protein [Parvibaculum sp.]MBO6679167.1 hypothetical protein [Parvibaculum sp.]MBO6685646.1 hypothetical protein [Parvibaculum sp.]MBO6905799.1 hypothetical protein [Parvibaculum sp.]
MIDLEQPAEPAEIIGMSISSDGALTLQFASGLRLPCLDRRARDEILAIFARAGVLPSGDVLTGEYVAHRARGEVGFCFVRVEGREQ